MNLKSDAKHVSSVLARAGFGRDRFSASPAEGDASRIVVRYLFNISRHAREEHTGCRSKCNLGCVLLHVQRTYIALEQALFQKGYMVEMVEMERTVICGLVVAPVAPSRIRRRLRGHPLRVDMSTDVMAETGHEELKIFPRVSIERTASTVTTVPPGDPFGNSWTTWQGTARPPSPS